MSCNDCTKKPAGLNDASCPMRMSDGRAFTDYRPRCAVYNSYAPPDVTNGNSYDSRMFLIHNAEKIIQEERTKAFDLQRQTCPCTGGNTQMPEKYVVRCTPTSCTRTMVNPNGVGDGRAY